MAVTDLRQRHTLEDGSRVQSVTIYYEEHEQWCPRHGRVCLINGPDRVEVTAIDEGGEARLVGEFPPDAVLNVRD